MTASQPSPDQDRQNATTSLRSSAEHLRLLIESVRDYAIFSFDPAGKIDSWNSGAERLLGYTEADVIGQDPAIIFTPEDRAQGAHEQERHQAVTEGCAEDERWHLRKDGSRFYASGVLTPMYDDRGALRGFVKVLRDLTERKLAADALQASEERLRLLIESVQDYAICTLDRGGQVTSWNSGGERLTGYADAEIIGEPIHRLYTPEDVAAGKPEHEMHQALTAGRSEDESWRVRKDNSRFWANEIIRPLQATDGTVPGFAKVIRDLTERKQAEVALQQAHDSLEVRVRERTAELAATNAALEAEIAERVRMEQERAALVQAVVTAEEQERRRIAREIHDQLGQTVTALRLGLTALGSEPSVRPVPHDRIAALQQLTTQLDSEVDRLAFELRPTVLEDYGLLQALEDHVQTWSERHRIAADIQTMGFTQQRVPTVIETVLYRVVQEALTNVLKHANAQQVSIIVEQRDGTVHLIIEDEGRGFHPESVLHTSDGRHHQGVRGMQERVSLVGGTLTIESEPGQGTTLFVHIPLSAHEQDTTHR